MNLRPSTVTNLRPSTVTNLRLSWFLALRHLRRRTTQNLISVIGVAIGVMVLTTALSLTNGFIDALFNATIKAQPHISLEAWDKDLGGSPRDPALEKRLKDSTDVVGFAPYLESFALLSRRAAQGRGGSQAPALLYGVVPLEEAKALNLNPDDQKRLETLPENGILLGRDLARSLSPLIGDEIYMLVFDGADVSKIKRTKFVYHGSYTTNNYQIDNVIAFVGLPALQTAKQSGENISGYHVRLSNPNLAPRLANVLPASLEPNTASKFYGRPWQDAYRNLIDSMNLQKQVIGAVLVLILIVAAFGMVNVFLLTVFEKTPEIAILRAMGASAKTIQNVFLLEGAVLGGIGLVLGNLLGLAVSYYFVVFPFRLPGDLFFINALPADPRALDFLWVSGVSLVTTLLAAYIPARRAVGIEPARIIR
jgi:lipoprotein-releasing system permease protein